MVAALTLAAPVRVAAAPVSPTAAAGQAEPHGAAQPVAGEAESAEAEGHDTGWSSTLWKAANFGILVGVLVYFLRAPVLGYLDGRIGKVREDLVTAAQTRETAQRQLAAIEAQLKALPAELDALRGRGAEDIVAERGRIEQAAEVERQRLLDHTRREIEMRLRIARRELLELGADLAVRVASDRIQQSITPDDQARMVDRYASQLPSHGARP